LHRTELIDMENQLFIFERNMENQFELHGLRCIHFILITEDGPDDLERHSL